MAKTQLSFGHSESNRVKSHLKLPDSRSKCLSVRYDQRLSQLCLKIPFFASKIMKGKLKLEPNMLIGIITVSESYDGIFGSAP